MRFKSKKAKALVALVAGLTALFGKASADSVLDLSDVEAYGYDLAVLLATAWAVWRVPNATDPGESTSDTASV